MVKAHLEQLDTLSRQRAIRTKPKQVHRLASKMATGEGTRTTRATAVPPRVPSLRLLTLPQELQDEIFTLAYPEDTNTNYTIFDRWAERERERRLMIGTDFVPATPLVHKVSEFMVSKRFFAAASRAWISN